MPTHWVTNVVVALNIIKQTFLFLFLVEIAYALITIKIYIFMKYVYNFLQFPTLLLDVHMPAEAKVRNFLKQ